MSGLLSDLQAQLGSTFRIERELGGGGMSQVFLAEEVALGRRVVLKVLPPDLAHVVSDARFEREVRVAARLQHPHIVPLLAAGRAGAALYFTMPHVEGESLRARLERERELPIAEAARLLREIADALSYAHGEGVVHRDIKPDNILLSHQHAMITDFGVARAVKEAMGAETLTQTGMVIGSPAYMAPEQASGEGGVDERADLYALGVLAYEILAGQPPFRGANFQALIAAHLTQTPQALTTARPSVPPALAALVHRCLEKRPADRFQTAREFLAALDRLPPTGTSALVREVALPVSRRTALKTVVGVGLVGAAYFGGMWMGRGTRSNDVPSYHRLTFRRGLIRTARFGPDFRTVFYGALWDGDVCRTFAVRPESPESAPLPLAPGAPLAVSSTGELALSLGTQLRGIMPYGTLARAAIAGGAPRELQERVKYADWAPDGSELVLVRRVGEGDRLELSGGRAIATPATPAGGFSFPRFSPAGDAVAVFELDNADWLNGHVVVIDMAGKKRTTSVRFFNVFGLAWFGDEVWFTAADQLPLFRNTLYAMRRSGEVRIVARVPGNATLHDIAPDGRLLLARTDDRSGITVRVPGERDERDLSWLDASVIADLSADGLRMLFSETGPGGGPRSAAYLRGTDGSPAVRLSDGHAESLSPDGQWAIVRPEVDAAHLMIVPTGAGESVRLAREGLRLQTARWLRDGRQVVVRALRGEGSDRLYVLEARGSGTRALTPERFRVGRAGWAVAPDGLMVACIVDDAVELFPVDGSASRRVGGVPRGARVVGWTKDGVLISDDPVAQSAVDRFDPATGRRERWADLRPRDPTGIMNVDLGQLVVTPDGRAYAYSWHRAVSDLYLMEGVG